MSALLGRIPSAVGYQPTLATDMGTMQERITTTKKGSITSVQAVFVPADDLTDPAPATTFAHLDATTVLSRAISGVCGCVRVGVVCVGVCEGVGVCACVRERVHVRVWVCMHAYVCAGLCVCVEGICACVCVCV